MGDFGAVDGHELVSNKAIFSLVPSTILFRIAAILPSAACAENAGAHDFPIREARRFDVVSARLAAQERTQRPAAFDRTLDRHSSLRQAQAPASARRSGAEARPRLACAQSEQELDVENAFAGAWKTHKPPATDAPASRLRVAREDYIY